MSKDLSNLADLLNDECAWILGDDALAKVVVTLCYCLFTLQKL